MDENPYKSPCEEAGAQSKSPSLFRTFGVSLARVVATLLVLTPFATLGPWSSFFVGYHWFPIPITCFVFFLGGVWLHWIVAKTTEAYFAWVYWLIFLVSVPLLGAVPIGTIPALIAIYALYTSDTFRQMRNGKRSRGNEPSTED